jgi:hypothetical protein
MVKFSYLVRFSELNPELFKIISSAAALAFPEESPQQYLALSSFYAGLLGEEKRRHKLIKLSLIKTACGDTSPGCRNLAA